MVGNDMKRFAEKNGLTVNFKMAYGVYKGYVISLMDRDASRSLTISIRLKDERALKALNERLNSATVKSRYWISVGTVTASKCEVRFRDTLGVLRKIALFLEDFPDELRGFGAQGAEICAKCGKEIGPEAGTVTSDGHMAVMMHAQCALQLQEERPKGRKGRGKELLKRIMGALRRAG